VRSLRSWGAGVVLEANDAVVLVHGLIAMEAQRRAGLLNAMAVSARLLSETRLSSADAARTLLGQVEDTGTGEMVAAK
jgi:hypothetical protein